VGDKNEIIEYIFYEFISVKTAKSIFSSWSLDNIICFIWSTVWYK